MLCNASASQSLLDFCDYTASAVAFTGDDVIAIRCGTEIVDVIGQIGVAPGTTWGSGDTATADHTLRRDCGVTEGDADGEDAFDVSGWSGYAIDTFDGLGDPTCAN